MATSSVIETYSGGLDAAIKSALKKIFDYVLKNVRFGRPGHQDSSENFSGSFVEGTTHAVANTEFSIEHGRDTAPYLAIPVLDLNTVGSRIPPLQVTQAADGRRIYLSSSETDVAISLYLE